MTVWLKENINRTYVMLWRDGNRACFLTGNAEHGLNFSFVKSTDAENKHTGKFYGQSPYPTIALAGVLEDALNRAEFSNEFSFDFNI